MDIGKKPDGRFFPRKTDVSLDRAAISATAPLVLERLIERRNDGIILKFSM